MEIHPPDAPFGGGINAAQPTVPPAARRSHDGLHGLAHGEVTPALRGATRSDRIGEIALRAAQPGGSRESRQHELPTADTLPTANPWFYHDNFQLWSVQMALYQLPDGHYPQSDDYYSTARRLFTCGRR